MSAAIGAGIAQGAANLATAMNDMPQRRAREEEALAQRQLAQAKLSEFSAGAGDRAREAEMRMQQLESQQTRMFQADLSNATQIAAKQHYAEGSDYVKVWNNFLHSVKNNPSAQRMFGTTQSVQPLAKTPAADEQLRALGYTDLDAVYNNPRVSKDFLTITTSDGGPQVLPVSTFIAGTGAQEALDKEERAAMESVARYQGLLRQGFSEFKAQAAEETYNYLMTEEGGGMSAEEAYTAVLSMEKTGNGTNYVSTEDERAISQVMIDRNVDWTTAMGIYYKDKKQVRDNSSADERIIKQMAEQNYDGNVGAATEAFYGYKNKDRTSDTDKAIEMLRADPENEGKTDAELLKLAKNLTSPSVIKNIEYAEKIEEELDADNFFDTAVSSLPLSKQRSIGRKVQKLEQVLGIKQSEGRAKALRTMRKLIGLGGTASDKLTSEQSGWFDSILGNVKKYTYDSAEGKEATAAYETFRNIFRNSLYGAAQSKQESAHYTSGAGSRYQQFQPMMAAFKVQMQTVKDELESISRDGNQYLSHYYLGKDVDEVDSIIQRLDDQIAKMSVATEKVTLKMPSDVKQDTITKDSFDYKAAFEQAGE